MNVGDRVNFKFYVLSFAGCCRTENSHKRRKIHNRRLIRRDVALVLLLIVHWFIVVSAECWDDGLWRDSELGIRDWGLAETR
jgi:hypothetical protein